ncbi:MAG: ABC transporter ATP-binding protein [Candidatus Thermoplasmatota archaeon]|jgi:iron complex transport system ATP-binding protein|nr:ABC transporter ATP-binding protein [Candidatus Thermoplasmatota archaeon]
MIDIHGLTVRYGKKIALNNLDLRVGDGEHLILMGPNGSGKTTLLRALLGLVRYDGTISLNGKSTNGIARRELAREIAYVPQIFSTPYTFTVKEFVSMGLYSLSREWWIEDERIHKVLSDVGIDELKEKTINTLSGGELQKAIIARALVQDSNYILMDEPTAHLDIRSTQEVLEVVSNFKDKGTIIVSHDLNALNKLGGSVLLIKNGEIVFKGMKDDPDFKGRIMDTFETRIGEIGGFFYFPLS